MFTTKDIKKFIYRQVNSKKICIKIFYFDIIYKIMENIFSSIFYDVYFLNAFFQTILVIFLGFIFRRKNIINSEGKKTITTIVWKIAVPCLAFSAFMQDFKKEHFFASISELILAAILYLILFILGKTILFRKQKDISVIGALFIAVGQTTLFSMPILQAVYSGREQEVMLYMNTISLAFRIMVYVVGFYTISGEKIHLKTLKTSLKRVFLTPIMIGMFGGMIIWLTQNVMPQVKTSTGYFSFLRIDKTLPFIYMTIISLSKLLNPLAMFLIGMTIGEAEFSTSFKDKNAWLVALCRNFLAPVIVLFISIGLHILGIIKFNEYSLIAIVIAFSAPISVTLSMLCVQYKKEDMFAARACLISTILSIVSMPLMFIAVYKAFSFLK